MNNPTFSEDPDNKDERPRWRKALDSLLHKDNIDRFYSFASSNTRDTLAYILLLTGLLLLFFEPFYAGALIGVIFGLYFSEELIDLAKNYRHVIQNQASIRSLIFAGLLISLLISAPFIFLGTFVAVTVKQLID